MTYTQQHTIECASRVGEECNCPMGRGWATVADLRAQLATYIGFAFKYETEFLETFCGGLKPTELIECYMGDTRSKIVVLVPSGTQISTTISTTKFMAWCDAYRENLTSDNNIQPIKSS